VDATVRVFSVCLVSVGILMMPGAARGDDRLIDAVRAGDRAAVARLIRTPGAVNAAEADGTTALHAAAWSDTPELVDVLLRAGADARAANRYGVTALSLAALNRNAAITRMLLAAGADPNAPLEEGQTILMAAARAGSADVVELLVEAGADVNARESVLGETALMWAAMENHGPAVSRLVRRGADIDARSHVMTFPRFKFGDGIVARPTVLPKGGWTALMYAARENAIEAARALADAGADLDATDPDGTSALVFAIINGHYDLAQMLAERGADPDVADVTGATALYAVVDMNTLDETVGRPNPKPHATIDPPALVRTLLVRGADPDARLTAPVLERMHNDGDPSLAEGATALMRAAKDADVAVMRILLEHGADVSLRTKTRRTALMFAAGRSSGFRGSANRGSERDALAAIDLCLERGADVNAADENGQTALHIAVAQAEASVLRRLVEKGANPQLEDAKGRTPLDLAQGGGGRGGRGAVQQEKVALLRELTEASAPRP
jgi:ankyrin repeat protein